MKRQSSVISAPLGDETSFGKLLSITAPIPKRILVRVFTTKDIISADRCDWPQPGTWFPQSAFHCARTFAWKRETGRRTIFQMVSGECLLDAE